ncbi:MAG TPA: ABC transporter substrate-binding protein [candidate division Zixibacteria bacterium]|nr:ABC transporter substrate-binding protein [candidate division Zixibacteria bacterium]
MRSEANGRRDIVGRAAKTAVVLALAWLVGTGAAAAQGAREKIRVALGSISVNSSVIPIGHQAGIFAKHGVDLEPIYMGGGMNSLAAVTSNSVQFLAAGSTATISARLGGVDITMLSVQSNKLDYTVFAAPEIRSVQDLRGKIVTGTRPGASADSALRLWLRRSGLTPDKDVVFISVADSQQGRLNALHRGSVVATVLAPPFSGMAKRLGLRELADLRKTDIEYSGTSIAGMASYIRNHPQLVENFLKGYIESLHYFRTQRERTIAGIMRYLKITDRARAEEGYDYYVDLMPEMPYASPKAVRAVLQFLAANQPKAATANPEDFYDMSFLKKIEGSGFAKSLASVRY